MSEEALLIAEERCEVKGKGERERYTKLSAEFQRIGRRDMKVFLNEKCKEIQGNDRMRKKKDLFKKTGDIKEIFGARMYVKKGSNSKVLTEAEEIKKRWQEHTQLYKKDLKDQITMMVSSLT